MAGFLGSMTGIAIAGTVVVFFDLLIKRMEVGGSIVATIAFIALVAPFTIVLPLYLLFS